MNSLPESNSVNLMVKFEVNPSEIICCIAEINYTKIYYSSGITELIPTSLKKVEKRLLPHDFHRVHKSYLINRRYIVSVIKNSRSECYIELENNLKMAVARRRTTMIKKYFAD